MKWGMAAFAGALALASRLAVAQDGDAGGFRPFDDTTRLEVALQAQATNARIFGAVGSLERNVLPNLAADGSFVARYETNMLFEATRVPGECTEGCTNRFVLAPVSTYAASFAAGTRFGPVSLFYASGITGSTVQRGGRAGAITSGLTLQGIGFLGALGAPFIDNSNRGELDELRADYIFGAGFDDDSIGAARIGYIGSKGVFFNVTQSHTRAFATTALSDAFNRVGLLKTGFDRLVLDKLTGAKDAYVGMTSLYARRTEFAAPISSTDPRPVARRLLRESAIAFWTTHLQHQNLLQVIDFYGVYAVAPNAFIHDLRFALHTPGYHAPPVSSDLVQQYSGKGKKKLEEWTGLSINAGFTELPSLPFYGVTGGRRMTVSVEGFVTAVDEIPFRLSIQRNHPDVLLSFPYAQNAWNVYVLFGAGDDEIAARRAQDAGYD